MEIRNPYHVDGQKARIEALAAAIDAYLQAAPDRPALTFDELRAAVPAAAAETDGAIHAALRCLGCDVNA